MLRPEDWFNAMKAKGHTPRMDHGDIDMFVLDISFGPCCHGPGCGACGWMCCIHCDKDREIPECKQC